MQLEYRRLDVFTDVALGGNPLAVFLDVPELPADDMQAVAREMNLSESVFVRRGATAAEWLIRIFTPGVELPFAGHPTIGTAVALALDGRADRDNSQIELLAKVGRLRIRVTTQGTRLATATFAIPRLPEAREADLPPAILAEILGIEQKELLDQKWCPRALSCGVPFYFVALRSLQAIRRVKLRRDLWERHLANHWAPHLYIFTPQVERRGSVVHARMFAPAMGVEEDPATGGAVAALSCYLFEALGAGEGRTQWRVEQGLEMGRPSLIGLEIDVAEGAITAVRLSGSAVVVGAGHLLI